MAGLAPAIADAQADSARPARRAHRTVVLPRWQARAAAGY
eukprot:SAG11_NODE_8055_length_1064_cov_4.866321_1_plen_40_part_00